MLVLFEIAFIQFVCTSYSTRAGRSFNVPYIKVEYRNLLVVRYEMEDHPLFFWKRL